MFRRSWLLILSFLVVLNLSTNSKAAFNGHVSIVNSVVYSADGKWALSGSWDWTMRLWDLSTHKPVRKFKDHILSVNHAVFSPDGKQVLSASAARNLVVLKRSLIWTYHGLGQQLTDLIYLECLHRSTKHSLLTKSTRSMCAYPMICMRAQRLLH